MKHLFNRNKIFYENTILNKEKDLKMLLFRLIITCARELLFLITMARTNFLSCTNYTLGVPIKESNDLINNLLDIQKEKLDNSLCNDWYLLFTNRQFHEAKKTSQGLRIRVIHLRSDTLATKFFKRAYKTSHPP